MSDPFGEFERAGWSAGRAEPYHQAVGAISREAIPRLLDAAGVGAGTRLLDVATGPGYAAAAAAARGAAATGVDFSAEMVALARRLHPGAEFAQADAQALPFADGAFDAVVANFLMPHVSDLPAVVRELARVARPGGRVALTTWDAETVGFLRWFLEAAAEAGAVPPPDLPPGPPFFQFSRDDEFAALLADAGLAGAEVGTVAFVHRIDDLDRFWADLLAGSVRSHALVLSQTAEVQAAIRRAYEARLAPFARAGGFDVPCAVKLGVGTVSTR